MIVYTVNYIFTAEPNTYHTVPKVLKSLKSAKLSCIIIAQQNQQHLKSTHIDWKETDPITFGVNPEIEFEITEATLED